MADKRLKPPVEVGDLIQVEVEALGARGDGIAKKDGFVIFVPKGQKGESYTVKISRVFPNMGFAEIVN